jgi:hypothetical protein
MYDMFKGYAKIGHRITQLINSIAQYGMCNINFYVSSFNVALALYPRDGSHVNIQLYMYTPNIKRYSTNLKNPYFLKMK